MPRPRPARAILVAVILFLILAVVPGFAGYLTDWLWFREVGYQIVFTKLITTKILLFFLTGLFAWAVIRVNIGVARGGSGRLPVMYQVNPNVPPVDISGLLWRIPTPLSILIAFFFGLAGAAQTMGVLKFLNRSSFGIVDPVFGRDIGWYFFTLPQLDFFLGVLRGLVLVSLILIVVIYAFRGRIHLPPPRVRIEAPADRHIAVLVALYFVLTALRIWLVRLPDLLYSTTGPLTGASYSDLHASYPALLIIAITVLIGVGLVILGEIRGKLVWYTTLSIVAYLVVSILVGGVYPAAVQRFAVLPTELTREAPQLQRHIAATRHAWGLDRVETRDLSGEAGLTIQNIRDNSATIQNVRLWDRDPLLQTFSQLQEIRTYYDFISVDDDRYTIDGRYRQVLLSPRELNAQSLPQRTFVNQHLTFTHGMGLTLGPVSEVTSEGLPVLYIKDLPPVSTVSINITRPQIYFGELTTDHVFVDTDQPEFDSPSKGEDIFSHYTGTGGVRVGNILKRALFAIRFGALNILLSGNIRADSRVMYNRDVMTRARTAFPYLQFDNDPYMVITSNGELRWILDAYTRSDMYPYSQALDDGTTYMRNSVKVVIDAYNGTMQAYITDAQDPLVQTYARIFPGTLRPMTEMPADIRAHIRYPRDLFRIQASLYTIFHMDHPGTFYHREDQWQLPMVEGSDQADQFMHHLVMRLPEEKKEEYIYMAPFTPRGKDNLAAWIVARNDGGNYGKLRVYRFPKQSLVYGPKQIMARINQDTDISRELTLWDQRGSQVIRGELLVIPVEEALLYVQPIYLRAESGKIPELKRVVVAFQNRVVMAETLDAGLARIFNGSVTGQAAPRATSDTTSAMAQAPAIQAPTALLDEARQHYDRALAAQRAGDWAAYGEEIRKLGETLARIRK